MHTCAFVLHALTWSSATPCMSNVDSEKQSFTWSGGSRLSNEWLPLLLWIYVARGRGAALDEWLSLLDHCLCFFSAWLSDCLYFPGSTWTWCGAQWVTVSAEIDCLCFFSAWSDCLYFSGSTWTWRGARWVTVSAEWLPLLLLCLTKWLPLFRSGSTLHVEVAWYHVCTTNAHVCISHILGIILHHAHHAVMGVAYHMYSRLRTLKSEVKKSAIPLFRVL